MNAAWHALSEGRRKLIGSLVGIAFLILIIIVWQWVATALPVFFLPTPTTVWNELRTEWFDGPPARIFLSDAALAEIGQTFFVAVLGWIIASAIGIVVGAALGAIPALRDYTWAALLFLRSIPAVAIVPIFIVVLGLGVTMRMTVVVFACVWPVLLNTAEGVATIERVQIDVARLNRLGPVSRLLRVLVPAASPKIFAGLRVAMSVAIVLTVVTEMLAGTGGLGGAAMRAQSTYNVPALWATIFVLALFGYIFNTLVQVIERYALAWHAERSSQ